MIGLGCCRIRRNNSAVVPASSIICSTLASRLLSRACKSAPEQKSAPAPPSTTTRTFSSVAHCASDSVISWIMAALSALRFAGRFKVMRAAGNPGSNKMVSKLDIGNGDLHAQERRAVGLPLRVRSQRHGAAAVQTLVEDEIQGAQVRQLETFDLAEANASEMFPDPCGGNGFRQDRI